MDRFPGRVAAHPHRCARSSSFPEIPASRSSCDVGQDLIDRSCAQFMRATRQFYGVFAQPLHIVRVRLVRAVSLLAKFQHSQCRTRDRRLKPTSAPNSSALRSRTAMRINGAFSAPFLASVSSIRRSISRKRSIVASFDLGGVRRSWAAITVNALLPTNGSLQPSDPVRRRRNGDGAGVLHLTPPKPNSPRLQRDAVSFPDRPRRPGLRSRP